MRSTTCDEDVHLCVDQLVSLTHNCLHGTWHKSSVGTCRWHVGQGEAGRLALVSWCAQVNKNRYTRTVCRAVRSHGLHNDAGDNATCSFPSCGHQSSCRANLAHTTVFIDGEPQRRQLLGLAAAVTFGALLPNGLARADPSGDLALDIHVDDLHVQRRMQESTATISCGTPCELAAGARQALMDAIAAKKGDDEVIAALRKLAEENPTPSPAKSPTIYGRWKLLWASSNAEARGTAIPAAHAADSDGMGEGFAQTVKHMRHGGGR